MSARDIKGVVATIEIKKEAQEYLSKDTRFWLVKPRVSPGWRHRPGNPGLRRLHRGRSGEGREGRTLLHRVEGAATLSDKLPGLHLTLKADRLGSWSRAARCSTGRSRSAR